ncbi:hypothetical protein [Caulobacter sp. UNC279MFTsu5.1]|uniref:hypothetical protein n=1 Tax=Caulobacter sp. UNC279MFTsu5.1 TaxID=1502775 RepID=UPI0008F177A3|nr:hypothetical protein [Caulobacter sp. UNC279MFTsu5.1]SFJ66204.1 hypothetical protein SAMN02799626_02297 [Caulobacter sp. UNC279MFTsu5.1]
MIQHRTVGLAATALALAASFTAASARAQDPARGGVGLDARVSQVCVLGEPNPAGLALGQISEASGTRVGRLAPIAAQTIQLPGTFCNYGGAALAISASPLAVTSGAAQAGFTGAVNYTCSISAWGATAATVRTSATNTAGDGVSSTSAAPKATDLTLVVSDFAAATDDLLQPGAYLALVTITLGPDAGLTASGS